MRTERLENYKKIEAARQSKLLVYITGDRQNAETNIQPDILPYFVNHLDKIGDGQKITLYLYSNGGSILAGWSLVNLIRSFCKDFEIIVPFKCQSTATLMTLGTNRIIMTKQATLGPIDPSTNGMMNPQVNINGQAVRVPVSVEHVNGYLEMAKNDFNIQNSEELLDVYLKLTDHIHPLSLGNVYKSKAQIQMLAEKLLKHHEILPEKVPTAISFLCSESGSHDYTIYRKEAKEDLGLNIETPSMELYNVIKEIYQDIESELDLRNPYNPNLLVAGGNAAYSMRRALIESVDGGCDVFMSNGIVTRNAHPTHAGQFVVNDTRTFEGWKHEN